MPCRFALSYNSSVAVPNTAVKLLWSPNIKCKIPLYADDILLYLQDAYPKTLKSRCLILYHLLNLCLLCCLLVYSNVPAVRHIKEISCLINHRIPAREQREPAGHASHLSDCPWRGAEWPACGNDPGQRRAETRFIQPTGYDCPINTHLSFLKCPYWEWT